MKRKLLLMLVPILGAFFSYSQAEILVVAPSATTGSSFRSPNGTTAHTTMRGVIIVPASELTGIPASTIITKLGLIVSTAGSGPAGGTIQYYLENTADVTNLKSTDWNTVISTMTSVYNGPFALPTVAGPTSDLTLTSSFTYTGGSLYVAFDYLGSTFTSTACVYSANSSITGGWKGLASATTTPPATITQTSAFRPSFRFTFANPFTNELNVTGVAGEKGIFNNSIKTTQTVTSLISNTSQGDLFNVPVTLNVTGANPFTVIQTVPSIASGTTSTILFNNVPTSSLGAQTITVSIPADENNTNNSRIFTQQVQCDTIGYAQSPIQSGAVGFNTGSGLIAVSHNIPSGMVTFVKSVSNYFPITASVAGNTMKGILLDGNGVILDSTNTISITAGMLGTKQSFDFLNGAIDVSGGVIYVGFRQDANATVGYFPFANQNNSYVDPNAAATFNLFGGGLSPLGSSLGYMMIDAVLTYGGFDVPNSSSSGILCINSPLSITPTSGYTNYQFFVDGLSVQNGASPTYTTAPLTTGVTFNVDITNGTCLLNSNVQSINIGASLLTNLSAGICPGQSYTFGSQTLSTGGVYTDSLSSSQGCDSIVILNLASLLPSTYNFTVNICQGESYFFGTQTLTSPGVYIDVLTNAIGCDSTITLNLLINSPSTSTITETVCDNVYQFGSQTLTASGTYIDTIANAVGCDSIITLNLVLNPTVTVSATTSGVIINSTASPSVTTYQWIDCVTGNAIAGATSSSFSPTVNGTYAVVVNSTAGCTDTSNCAVVNSLGLDELALDALIKVYPNPTVNWVHVVSNGSQILNYSVIDKNGRVIIAKSVDENETELDLSLESISEGMYILEVQTSEGIVFKRIVKL